MNHGMYERITSHKTPRIVNPEFLPPQKVMKNEKSAKKTKMGSYGPNSHNLYIISTCTVL